MKTSEANPHPDREAWASWLYGELPPEKQSQLTSHLKSCPACQAVIQPWRQAMESLNGWQLATRPARRTTWLPRLRLAAAAVVILGAGVLAGRLSTPRVDPALLAASIAPAIREEVRKEFEADLQSAMKTAQIDTDRKLDEMALAWATARQEDQQATLTLVTAAERQRRTDFAWLRRDLETVAVNADERFDTTRRALGQLAAYSQPLSDPPNQASPSQTP
ncbi:MAG: anti-sigma factor family protein [Limisphaerales bacterium]